MISALEEDALIRSQYDDDDDSVGKETMSIVDFYEGTTERYEETQGGLTQTFYPARY